MQGYPVRTFTYDGVGLRVAQAVDDGLRLGLGHRRAGKSRAALDCLKAYLEAQT